MALLSICLLLPKKHSYAKHCYCDNWRQFEHLGAHVESKATSYFQWTHIQLQFESVLIHLGFVQLSED